MNRATHCAWHPEETAKATLALDGRGMCAACFGQWRMHGVAALDESTSSTVNVKSPFGI